MATVRQFPCLAPSFLSTHPTYNVPEAATQTYKQGALLAISAGYAQELATNGALIVGFAAAPGMNLTTAGTAQGAFDGLAKIIPALPHVQFEMNIDSAGTLGAYTSLVTNIGSSYGVTKDSNGVWYIDVDKTGGIARVIVTGFRDPIGTVGARVFCVVRYSTSLFGS